LEPVIRKYGLFFMLALFVAGTGLAQSKDTLQVTDKGITDGLYATSGWRFRAGDSLVWASPGYNDHTWKRQVTMLYNEKDIQDIFKAGFKGIGWFRKYINIDTALIHKVFALKMEGDGAVAVYLDGNLLEKFGRFRTEGKSLYVDPQLFPLTFAVDTPGIHLLAIKYENYDIIDNKIKQEEGFGFSLSIARAGDAIRRYRSQILLTSIFLWGISCVFGALAFVHFILFLFYKRSISNLYFGLFNFSVGLMFLCGYVTMNITIIKYQSRAQYTLIIAVLIACFALSAFVNNLFPKRKWSFWIVAVLAIATLGCLFLVEPYTENTMLVLVTFASLEAIILIIIAIVRKIPGSRILGTGVLFFFAFIITVTCIVLFAQNQYFRLSGINGFVIMILGLLAIFSIPLSMSVYLARDFAQVNKSLSTQLLQVELLSQKTLEQEQEKQQLLISRKEELEQEIALRTGEVLQQKAQIEIQHEALKAEKKKSDELLLNILPAEVAEELKEKGYTKAQHFDHVTVLFTDFVNFTHIAEQLSADDLVSELDECFRAFDEIIERNGMEKIKTIGDAYLAVSGMPVYNERHAYNAVKAALEITAFTESRSRKENAFEIRIGINSGPLVAGIVGVKKFAYDIWGDTVNMASRMESNSEAGKVNISSSTYELVKHEFTCTHRGQINAKNKGDVDMYFVDKLK